MTATQRLNQTRMTERRTVEVNLQVATERQSPLPAAADFGRWVQMCLRVAEAPVPAGACVTVRLVDEAEIAGLNGRFRAQERATNVLAFPAGQPVLPPDVDEGVELGDLVICMDVVTREAAEQGKKARDHLAHLTVHGTLHLVGYDHVEDADAAVMEAMETRVLAELGIADPYQDCHAQDAV